MPPPWKICSPQTERSGRTSSSSTCSLSVLAAERSAAGCSSFTKPTPSPLFGPIDAALARSRAEAPRLLAELLSLDPGERLVCIHADQRFVSWGLCEVLIRRSCQTAPEQPSEALHLAELAVYVADRISEAGLFEDRWVYQLRSLAWATLGNALRVQGDLSGAERSFDMADSWWEAGTVATDDALGYEPILLDLHR